MGRLKRLLVFGIISCIISITACSNRTEDLLSYSEFKEQAEITEEQAFIGTNIKLHQEIHSNGKTQYRYKLETDCPHWKYEDRYLSDTAFPWLNDHSAVETTAREITIQWNGETLVTGQHFYVPLLKLNQDDIDYDTYKEQLYQEAYRQYQSVSEQEADKDFIPIVVLVILISVGIVKLFMIAMAKDDTLIALSDVCMNDTDKVQILLLELSDTKILVCVVMAEQMNEVLSVIQDLRIKAHGDLETAIRKVFAQQKLPIDIIGKLSGIPKDIILENVIQCSKNIRKD